MMLWTRALDGVTEMEQQIGVITQRIVVDRGYQGHNASPDYRFKVYISGQKTSA